MRTSSTCYWVIWPPWLGKFLKKTGEVFQKKLTCAYGDEHSQPGCQCSGPKGVRVEHTLPMVCSWGMNIQFEVSGLREGEQFPEDPTSLSCYFHFLFLSDFCPCEKWISPLNSRQCGGKFNTIEFLTPKTLLKPPKRHKSPHWEHDDSGFVGIWSLAKGLSHEVSTRWAPSRSLYMGVSSSMFIPINVRK